MLDEIGDIIVFGLEEREDRWARCKKILHDNGIKKITRFANKKGDDLYKTQTEDFLRVLQLKKGNIVFFEDDFELTDGWKDVFMKAWNDLPENWDLLYLGANLTKKPKRITENLVKIRGAWCFHAVVIHPMFAQWALKHYNLAYKQVWDEWLRNQAEGRNFYMTYPMISYQRESYSDFVGKVVNYNIFNNKYYLGL